MIGFPLYYVADSVQHMPGIQPWPLAGTPITTSSLGRYEGATMRAERYLPTMKQASVIRRRGDEGDRQMRD